MQVKHLNGNLASEAGRIPMGFTHDSHGRELSYKNSDGFWCERTYDSKGRVLSHKNSGGYWYKYTYDTHGRELSYKKSTGFWYKYTRDSHGRELSYKDSDGFWCERTYDSKGRELSYKDSDFDGIHIADDGRYVLHYDNTNDTFLAGCSDVLTREQAIKRWDRDDNRALLYTLAIGVIKQFN